jgi:hypothetical protein
MIDTGQVRFFEPWELERDGVQWWQQMSPRLLIMLDVFRFQWGRPVNISGHKRAVGRHMKDGLSQHNVDKWGEVRAIDVQPAGMTTRDEAERALAIAESLGFTGFGLYPHWSGGPGLHLDVRHDRDPGYPTTWGAVLGASGQMFVSLRDALEVMP